MCSSDLEFHERCRASLETEFLPGLYAHGSQIARSVAEQGAALNATDDAVCVASLRLMAAALAWDGVADASRSDVCDHAATARVAARLQEVSASLNRIAAVDGEDPVRDPRHACAALACAWVRLLRVVLAVGTSGRG